MQRGIRSFLPFLLLNVCVIVRVFAQYPAQCDTRKSCIYNALHQTVTTGKGAQYVEVSTGQAIDTIRSALTFEAWVLIEQQFGHRQFLAGIWGPHRNQQDDDNDVWVLYIDESDSLVFEVNSGSVPGNDDHVRVAVPADSLYGNWHHIAAVFDGADQSVKIYVDGIIQKSARNNRYPAITLHRPAQKFPLLIGNSNAFSDNANYRTYLGWMDEIRIWARALTDSLIRCWKDRSLNGNEPGLVLYYRCNEEPSVFELCDATGNNQIGLLRSGARCERSNRRLVYTNWTDLPSPLVDTLLCDETKQYIFQVQDTSYCGSRARLSVVGPDRNYFSVAPSGWFSLESGKPVLCTLTVNTPVIGDITAELRIIPDNRCARYLRIPLNLRRETELLYSTNKILFDTLLAYCREERWNDATFTICNQTNRTANPKPILITKAINQFPAVFQLLSPSLPLTVQPGECRDFTLRFYSTDSTRTYQDTLKIYSTDGCAPVAHVVLEGSVQEVIQLIRNNKRVDTLQFEPTCPQMVSAPVYYTWQNNLSVPLQIDTIIMPPFIVGRKFRFPVTLLPNTGYPPNYFRFRPTQPGWVFDSVIFRMRVGNCTIDRVVYVSGRGLDSELSFVGIGATDTLDFGVIVIGQKKQDFVRIQNHSVDPLNLAFYVEQGEGFLLPMKNSAIPVGGIISVPVIFQPSEPKDYYDKFCYFEKRCFNVDCIVLRGRGIIQTFLFQPAVPRIENVLGCESGRDTIDIQNISGSTLLLAQINFADPSGKFQILSPAPLPNEVTLEPGQKLQIVVQYTPSDVFNDRVDKAYLRFTADGKEWELPVLGTSIVPKLYVTPLTTYGVVEVGDRRIENVIVQNISSVPVRIDSISVSSGYRIVSTTPPTPAIIAPRDSLVVEVAFEPLSSMEYRGEIVVYSSNPCSIPPTTGELEGVGTFVELDVPLSVINFGYVRSCECEERLLPMINGSMINEAVIDSIWFESPDTTSFSGEQFFAWRSVQSGSITPYSIPALSNDTLVVSYCPRSYLADSLLQHSAYLYIKAHSTGWDVLYRIFLSGKQVKVFEMDRLRISFVDSPVDTVLKPEKIKLTIPPIDKNPWQDLVRIDSIGFSPDDRVFFVNAPFPLFIRPGDTLTVEFRFKPRSARTYSARALLYCSEPCVFVDSSIQVEGTGFAQPYGLQLTFSDRSNSIDTTFFIPCDTIRIPLYFSRPIPGTVVDISLTLRYDTTLFTLSAADSKYIVQYEPNFPPKILITPNDSGAVVLLKNFAAVDSIDPFVELSFVPKQFVSTTSVLRVDSVVFDTEDVLYYQIVAGIDAKVLVSRKPDFQVQNTIDFGVLKILECGTDTLVVVNSGDTAIAIDQVENIPADVEIIEVQPPFGTYIGPGDSIILTIRYCPRFNTNVSDSLSLHSISPCQITKSAFLTGKGYAPVHYHRFGLLTDSAQKWNTNTTIGDTISLVLYSQDSLSARYDGVLYWLNGVDFQLQLFYNPSMMKLIGVENLFDNEFLTVQGLPGTVTLSYTSTDSLSATPLAKLNFLILVPDTVAGMVHLVPAYLRSDSLEFLKPIFLGDTGYIQIQGECTVQYLKFSGVPNSSLNIKPNPAQNEIEISIMHSEELPWELYIWNAMGDKLRKLSFHQEMRSIGLYTLKLDVRELPSGVYLLQYRTRNETLTVPFLIAR